MRDRARGRRVSSRDSFQAVSEKPVDTSAGRRASFEPLERRVLMAAQLYEAEAAVVTGANVAHSPDGFTGSGFVDYVQPGGESVEWTIDVASAGTYALDLHYANGR